MDEDRQSEMASPSVAILAQKYDALVAEYDDLSKRYEKLRQHNAKCEAWNAQCYKKYMNMKASQLQWQAYYDKHQQKAKEAPTTAPISPAKTGEGIPEERSSLRVSSSQSTEAEQEPLAASYNAAPKDDDDVPEFVKARAVKRRRKDASPPPVKVKQEKPNSPENPISLSSDNYSSPVLQRKGIARVETSDLDAFVQHMNTPRKRRRQRGTSEEAPKPPRLPSNISSLSEGNLPQSDPEAIQEQSTSDSTDLDPTVKAQDFANNAGSKNNNALRPRSANITGSSRGIGNKRSSIQKRDREAKEKLMTLSEDGEFNASQTASTTPTVDNKTKERLNTLLEKPTPNRHPLSARRPPAPPTSHPKPSNPSPKKQPTTNTPKPKPQPQPQAQPPLNLSPPPPDAHPDTEPLRARPLPTLHLTDFKINPLYLGTTHAHTTPLRTRAERSCIPGCTQPCCLPTFRRIVELGALTPTVPDSVALERYLGPSYQAILAGYTEEGRKDAVLAAHAFVLAGQFGRHREGFVRGPSPPGFWRVDMPSTQEEEEDRRKAGEMEREKVGERWREAMREGGRWVFRDE